MKTSIALIISLLALNAFAFSFGSQKFETIDFSCGSEFEFINFVTHDSDKWTITLEGCKYDDCEGRLMSEVYSFSQMPSSTTDDVTTMSTTLVNSKTGNTFKCEGELRKL